MSTQNETIAVVEWFRSHRTMSNFMRNAGLGIHRVGIRERTSIKYKPGEVVDEERVLRAINYMINELNAEESEFEISMPTVISITTPTTCTHTS
jgi:hypothetical protein